MPSHLVARFVWKSARAHAPGRALLLAALGLCLAAALVPRASSGSGGGDNDDPGLSFKSKGGAKGAGVEFAPGEVLVQFREAGGAKSERVRVLRLRSGAAEIEARVERLEGVDAVAENLSLARVAPDATLAALEVFRERADVVRAELNFIRRPSRAPNDARYSSQWNMKNTAYPGFDIGAESAWETTTGSRAVVVGIIDEGIDINHEDLQANVWHNPAEQGGAAGVDDDGNGYVDDHHGWDFFHNDRTVYDGPGSTPGGFPIDAHGTHVAGIIGAQGDNAVGVAGVNWQTSLMSLKFIGPDGGRTSDLLRAYAYAKQMRELWEQSGGTRGANLRVLNNSYGGGGRSEIEFDAIRALGDAGILFVAAAGNNNADNDRFPHYPVGYALPNVVGVAGTSQFQGAYSSTNYGARTVHLSAPGQQVLSTTPGNTYTVYSGTSMAAPHVAGAAALVLAVNPSLGTARLRSALLYSGPEFFVSYAPTITSRRLSAAAALQNAAETDAAAPAAVGNLRVSTDPYSPPPLMSKRLLWTAPGDDGSTGRAALYEMRFADTAAGLESPAAFAQARPLPALLPATAGTEQVHLVRIPFRHPSGFVGVRAVDNAGNAGPVSVVAVAEAIAAADPYVASEQGAQPLTTGGTPLNLRGDDLVGSVGLPFRFTYFNTVVNSVSVSTNGAIYINNYSAILDAGGLATHLSALPRIAGMWDDLRTDRRAGDDVYVVQPDDDRVVIRWQAVTYNTPVGGTAGRGEHPVSFEIELRRDGAITTRYGAGNANLFPVVGLSGGEPDAYLVESHTSDISTGAFKNLGFAPSVVFTRRAPTPPPTTDVSVQLNVSPQLVTSGQQIAFTLLTYNSGPNEDALGTSASVELPAGLAFVSCTPPQGATCAAPAPGSSGTVTINLGRLRLQTQVQTTIVAQVTAPPAALLAPRSAITSRWEDPNRANNSSTVYLDVAESATFGGVRAVSAGGGNNGSHTLALKTDGSVYAWGSSNAGQLGLGGTSAVDAPALIPTLSGVAAVAAGSEHSYAVKSDGTLWSWGSNYYGQLGNDSPSYNNSLTPVQVLDLANVAAVATQAYHTLAIKTDGTVWGWGYNHVGQATGAQTSQGVRRPVQVAGLTGVAGVAVGGDHSLALKSDGTVWAWGSNQWGQCGPAAGSSPVAPVQVPGLGGVVAVAASSSTSFALKQDGTLWSWGSGDRGQRGDGTFQLQRATPLAVVNLSNVVAVEGGSAHALALKADGTVWSWGSNYTGALGDGTFQQRSTPVRVLNLANAAAASAGWEHSAALLSDGTLRTWGSNGAGQLGDRTTTSRPTPVSLSFLVTAAAPVFSPAPGAYSTPQDVTITNNVPGSIIRYTINGQEPTINDAVLTGSVHIPYSLPVKARAWKDGQGASPVVIASYQITGPPLGGVRFQYANFHVEETAGRAQLTVVRTGGTATGARVTVRTSDSSASNARCDTQTTAAAARCDYASTVETVAFAPGEVSKTVTIPIIDDAHNEISEGFFVSLADPVDAYVDFTGATTQVIINDNGDAAGAANPVESSGFFVRQQYLDFLSREPEQSGFDAWKGVLDRCPNVQSDPDCDRMTVSGSFFRSQEFELKGYFIYRFYKATLGSIPLYEDFVVDMRKVTGQTAEETLARRNAFVREWMARPAFRTRYDKLSNVAFVHQLLETAGVPSADGATRDALVAELQAGAKSRADVVRLVVESREVDAREYNGAFVAMQYYGYLRRTPEPGGYQSWLNYLNANPQDFRTMVGGFVNSVEYRLRFGQQ